MKKLIIISGPSGAGEDSVISKLQEVFEINRVITTTTREMREGESEGNPYYFISQEKFMQGVDSGEFFEFALQDRGKYYGVTNSEIERVRREEGVGVLKIDYKGVITVKEMLGEDAVAIMISAPIEVIAKRIKDRDNASDEFIQARIDYAQGWFEHRDIFDYEVENVQGRLDETVQKVANIIHKELGIDKK